MTIGLILTVLLVIMKINGEISLAWWLLFTPILGEFIFYLVVILLLVFVATALFTDHRT